MTLVADIIIGAGLVFIVVSTVALLIMPDLYTRAHAVAKSETLGLLLIFLGLFLRPELTQASYARLGLVVLFSLIGNPTAVHALIRSASRSGVLPWTVTDHRDAADQVEGDHRELPHDATLAALTDGSLDQGPGEEGTA